MTELNVDFSRIQNVPTNFDYLIFNLIKNTKCSNKQELGGSFDRRTEKVSVSMGHNNSRI